MLCLSSAVNLFFSPSPLYPSSHTDDEFLWQRLKVALSIYHALPCPEPSVYTHTNLHVLVPPFHTHTGVRGKSIHSCLASCTLFHLVLDHEWSLDRGMKPKEGPIKFDTHSNPQRSTSLKCLQCLQ